MSRLFSSPSPPSKAPIPSTQPERNSFTVVTEAHAVERARRDVRDRFRPWMAELLVQPAAFHPANREAMFVAWQFPDDVRRGLTALARNGNVAPAERMHAQLALARLGEAWDASTLVGCAAESVAAAAALFAALEELVPRPRPLPPVLVDYVVECLESPEPAIAEAAWQEVNWRELRAAEPVVDRLLAEEVNPELGLLTVAAWLRPSEEVLESLRGYLGETVDGNSNAALAQIVRLQRATTDAGLRDAAGQLCFEHLLGAADAPELGLGTEAAITALRELSPSACAIERLTQLVRDGRWTRMRLQALEELARLDRAAAETLAREVGAEPPELDEDFAEDLADGRTVSEWGAHFVSAGLLSPTDLDRALAAEERSSVESGRRISDVGALIDLFARLERYLAFQLEEGGLEARHDFLLMDLAQSSGSGFAPASVMEDREARRSGPFGPEHPVQFVHGDRLYRFGVRAHGGWLDVEPVFVAVHRALRDAGRVERFVSCDDEGTHPRLFFADPAALRRAGFEFQPVVE